MLVSKSPGADYWGLWYGKFDVGISHIVASVMYFFLKNPHIHTVPRPYTVRVSLSRWVYSGESCGLIRPGHVKKRFAAFHAHSCRRVEFRSSPLPEPCNYSGAFHVLEFHAKCISMRNNSRQKAPNRYLFLLFPPLMRAIVCTERRTVSSGKDVRRFFEYGRNGCRRKYLLSLFQIPAPKSGTHLHDKMDFLIVMVPRSLTIYVVDFQER